MEVALTNSVTGLNSCEVSIRQLALLGEVQQPSSRCSAPSCSRRNSGLLYGLEDPALAPARLDAWLAWASRSRLQPFIRLARPLVLSSCTASRLNSFGYGTIFGINRQSFPTKQTAQSSGVHQTGGLQSALNNS